MMLLEMDMNFIKIYTKNPLPDEPMWVYIEIDEQRYEIRKVEIFADHGVSYAEENEETGDTWLSPLPLGDLAEINANPEFAATEIAQEEFDRVWDARKVH